MPPSASLSAQVSVPVLAFHSRVCSESSDSPDRLQNFLSLRDIPHVCLVCFESHMSRFLSSTRLLLLLTSVNQEIGCSQLVLLPMLMSLAGDPATSFTGSIFAAHFPPPAIPSCGCLLGTARKIPISSQSAALWRNPECMKGHPRNT
jgi:hypothetical protein